MILHRLLPDQSFIGADTESRLTASDHVSAAPRWPPDAPGSPAPVKRKITLHVEHAKGA